MKNAALIISDLSVVLLDGTPVVDGVNLSCNAGEVLGIVGESGSGKTTAALSALAYARHGARILSGRVAVAGQELTSKSAHDLRRLRGAAVSYVPQDPGSALNPTRRIWDALVDVRRKHGRDVDPDSLRRLIKRVGLPCDDNFTRRYPYQLSGGQQQRVAFALALALEPPVVVLDEPTTGLDVVTQAQILAELKRLNAELGIAMLYVTHDIAAIAQIATRVAVMYAGRVVEEGRCDDILHAPRHPYTAQLMRSVPDVHVPRQLEGMKGQAPGPGEWPTGCAFAPRCSYHVEACDVRLPELRPVGDGRTVRCIRAEDVRAVVPTVRTSTLFVNDNPVVLRVDSLLAAHQGHQERVVVARDVSFDLRRGTCTALVGESGSGKTTLARCVAGLHVPEHGTIALHGTPLEALVRRRTNEQRRRIQMVFQNPAAALNPRHDVMQQIARPAELFRNLSAKDAADEARDLLERVRLPSRCLNRYPAELSGGERQRVSIARALAARPDVLVCDEITSALDVSVQAATLELLAELKDTLGLALLFITHDLGVVASVADYVCVLEKGHICEAGQTGRILSAPEHQYTRLLVDSAPSFVRVHQGTRP